MSSNNSQQSSPGGPNSVDSGNSSGKALDLSQSSSSSSNSSVNSDEIQQNTMIRRDKISNKSSKSSKSTHNNNAPEFQIADVVTLDLVKQCRDSYYRPNLSRDRAINMLKTAPFGSFIIRDSTSFVGGYGLAIRVEKLPERFKNNIKPGMDLLAEHVRHYLIESIETEGGLGYQIKGNVLEPVYPSLDMLVYKHILEAISLPLSLDLKLHTQHLPKTLNLLKNANKTTENQQKSKKKSTSKNPPQTVEKSPKLPEKTVKTTSFSKTIEKTDSNNNNISSRSVSVSTTKNIHTVKEQPLLSLDNLSQTLNSINSFALTDNSTTMRRTMSHNPANSGLGTGIGRMTSTQTIYSCHLVYIGCRDCEKLAGPAAVDRSLNSLLVNKKQNSSLIEFKIQKSGFTKSF